ncbi:MAG TPA: hypothetical protein DCL41_05820 [Bdellovibrionales bacterium]|nr:hypothetical protein [Bdellovibrionales bacterium]
MEIEVSNHPPENEALNRGFKSPENIDEKPPKTEAKSSLRMRYLAEVEIIRREIGGLEEVRNRLQLSRRKQCQKLMVDPSAWTRWCRDESKVPPHIWKMLWMLSSKGVSEALSLNHRVDRISKDLELEIRYQRRLIKTLGFLSLAFAGLALVLTLWSSL